MSSRLIDDDEVRALPPSSAVNVMRAAVVAAYRGQLSSPPRTRAELHDTDYVFTVGGIRDGASGFRAYRTGEAGGDQLVAVWDETGRLFAVIVGDELGARRTGALGAVAADALARPDANTVAIIGSSRQAFTQLWGLTAVRRLRLVRVYSPNATHRQAFADRTQTELRIAAEATARASDAISSADIVVLATRSDTPVIAAQDVPPGAHVITVGPKSIDAHETPPELVDRAALITCDSPAQAAAYGTAFFADTAALVHLGAVLTGDHPGRQHDNEITLHCSVGLAGTEALLANAIARKRNGRTGRSVIPSRPEPR